MIEPIGPARFVAGGGSGKEHEILAAEHRRRPQRIGQPADLSPEREVPQHRGSHGLSGTRLGRNGSASGVFTFQTRPRRRKPESTHQPGSTSPSLSPSRAEPGKARWLLLPALPLVVTPP